MSWGVCIKKKCIYICKCLYICKYIYINIYICVNERFNMGCAAVKPEMLQCDAAFLTSAALAHEGRSPWRADGGYPKPLTTG